MALAGLRKGTAYMTETKSGGGRWTPIFRWQDGDTKTLTFVTPAEEIAKIKVHEWVKVFDNSEKGFHWTHLMCRKDPAWSEESGNTCELCDVIGHKPKERHAAVAVELETIGGAKSKSFKVRTREFTRQDGTTAEYPQWGLVLQAFGNFYSYFSALAEREGDITGYVFDIARKGSDAKTAYPVFPIANAEFSLADVEIPSLEELLERIGSSEAYARELDGVEPGSQTEFSDDTQDATPAPARTKFEELRESLPGFVRTAGEVETY